MLQLSKALISQSIAFYPNQLPSSGSRLYVEYSQSYDQSSGSLQGTIISNPANTPWLVANIAGNSLPDASGQYIFYSYELVPGGAAVWNTDFDQWEVAATIWDDATGTNISDLLSVDRAYISGSDVEPITQYVSPNEDARYITYIG